MHPPRNRRSSYDGGRQLWARDDDLEELQRRHLTRSQRVTGDLGIPIGWSALSGQLVRLPEECIREHHFSVGRRSDGRAEFNRALINHKLRMKAAGTDDGAVVVVDSTGTLVQQLLGMIPEALANDVNFLDFGNPDRLPTLNFLDPKTFPGRDSHIEAIISAVTPLSSSVGPKNRTFLTLCLKALYEYNAHPDTSPQEFLTLLDVKKFAGGTEAPTGDSPEFRQMVLARVVDSSMTNLLDGPLKLDREEVETALTAFNAGMTEGDASGLAERIFGQRNSSFVLSDIVPRGRILLVSTNATVVGANASDLIGSTIVESMMDSLKTRGRIAAVDREWCLMVCEGCETLRGADWRNLLTEISMYGCAVLLSASEIVGSNGISTSLLNSVLRNIKCFVSYRVTGQDAELMSAEMDSDLVPSSYLESLEPLSCQLLCVDAATRYPVFQVYTADIPGMPPQRS